MKTLEIKINLRREGHVGKVLWVPFSEESERRNSIWSGSGFYIVGPSNDKLLSNCLLDLCMDGCLFWHIVYCVMAHRPKQVKR